jgi:hypothetical protein
VPFETWPVLVFSTYTVRFTRTFTNLYAKHSICTTSALITRHHIPCGGIHLKLTPIAWVSQGDASLTILALMLYFQLYFSACCAIQNRELRSIAACSFGAFWSVVLFLCVAGARVKNSHIVSSGSNVSGGKMAISLVAQSLF